MEFELIKVRTLLPPMFPGAGRKVGMVMAFIREVERSSGKGKRQ